MNALCAAAGRPPLGTVTLRAVDVPVERALARLLTAVPYTLHYELDVETEESVLARVALGEGSGAETVAVVAAEPRRGAGRERSRRTALQRIASLRSHEPEPQPDEASFEEKQAEAFYGLDDDSPEVRAEAADQVYPDEQGVDALAAMVTNDPAPGVRAAAAANLGYSIGDSMAVGALLSALHDPSSQVVLSALDALEFSGDHTTIPEIEFLLAHSDSEVREAALDAIWWLEE